MKCIIYVSDNGDIPIYEQYNILANYAKVNGYSISDKVLDFDGKNFHQAVNKVVADKEITTLLVFNKEVFADFEEYLFYRIFFEKLDKTFIICN